MLSLYKFNFVTFFYLLFKDRDTTFPGPGSKDSLIASTQGPKKNHLIFSPLCDGMICIHPIFPSGRDNIFSWQHKGWDRICFGLRILHHIFPSFWKGWSCCPAAGPGCLVIPTIPSTLTITSALQGNPSREVFMRHFSPVHSSLTAPNEEHASDIT